MDATTITVLRGEIKQIKKGKSVRFHNGVTVERNVMRPGYRVVDKNGKEYTSLELDHATLIAVKGALK